MPRFGRQLASVFLTIALIAGNVLACAGWTATPQARMACCSEDAACPMHGAPDDSAATHTVTQAEADQCCAASESNDPGSSPASTPFVVTLALVASPVPMLLADAPTRADVWSGAVPLPASHVPKHLLLSVFLV